MISAVERAQNAVFLTAVVVGCAVLLLSLIA
jgi:multisubunit Na+/H+ antiporter MnhC subunit